MSSTSYVKIYYGPCDSFHTLCHRPQKLTGLRDHLRRLGFRVDIQPVDHIDSCIIEMCGHEIFRCNINYLSFNTPHHLDPVAQRASAAVLDASRSFLHANTYLWLWYLIDDQMFKRSQYGPKDYFPITVDIEPFSLDCVKCCGILLAKKTEEELKESLEEEDNILNYIV